MSNLNLELNIEKYSLPELINIFNLNKFDFKSIKNSVSEKIEKISTLEIPSGEKNEIICFLKNVENTLLKDLEIIKLKETQNLLINEINNIKKNVNK